MKILVIPDIHQSVKWLRLFDGKFDIKKYDHIVQLGDWFDSYDKSSWKYGPIQNFEKIFEFKKELPITVLMGNHDMQYVTGDYCSGFQASHAYNIWEALFKHKDEMDVCKEIDGWVFSHAGLTNIWMKKRNVKTVDDINKLFHKVMNYWDADMLYRKKNGLTSMHTYATRVFDKTQYSGDDAFSKIFAKTLADAEKRYPEIYEIVTKACDLKDEAEFKEFMYNANVIRSFSFCGIDCYGDDVTQGPLWVRPTSLELDSAFDKQCVGHTASKEGPYVSNNNGKHFLYTDTVGNNKCVELVTNNGSFEYDILDLDNL